MADDPWILPDGSSPWSTGQPYGLLDGTSPAMEIVTHAGEVVIHPPQQFVGGDTWQIMATCLNADGSLMNLAGATIVWALNDSTGQLQNYITATVDNGGIIVAPPDPNTGLPTGVCYIVVTPDQSAALVAGFYMDQLVVQTTDGIVSTVFQGRIEVVARLPVLFLNLGAEAALAGSGAMTGIGS